MKKVLIFLLCCAVGYGCWMVFFNSDSAKAEAEQVVTDSVEMTLSVKNEIKEVQGDSVAEQDTLNVDVAE